MKCISEFHFREARTVDVTWWGLQPLACFVASERLVAAGIGSVILLSSYSCRLSLEVRIAPFAGAMVWVCLAVSKVASSFSALM